MTPLYPQNLALTSPTGGGRSVGIVRSRTKATEFNLVLLLHLVGCLYYCVSDSRSYKHQSVGWISLIARCGRNARIAGHCCVAVTYGSETDEHLI